MFAFTKQQKLVKTLKDISSTYNKISISATMDETKPLEIIQLQLEKDEIDREKLAIHYDAVKTEIENFNIILTHKDLWKVVKPRKAEGMIFGVHATLGKEILDTDETSIEFIKSYDLTLRKYYKAIRDQQMSVGTMGLSRFFRLAIEKKIKEDEIEKRTTYWKTLTGEDKEPSIESFIFSTLLEAFATNILYIKDQGNIDDVALSTLAKYHKINIGIIK